MSINIIWYDEASDDLEQIYDFYFEKAPITAVNIYNAILKQVNYFLK